MQFYNILDVNQFYEVKYLINDSNDDDHTSASYQPAID